MALGAPSASGLVNTSGAGSPRTQSIDVGTGTGNRLFVLALQQTDDSDSFGAITLGGESLGSEIAALREGTTNGWWLYAAIITVTGSQTLSIPLTGDGTYTVRGVWCVVDDVDGTAPHGAPTENSGSGTGPSAASTTCPTDGLVLALMHHAFSGSDPSYTGGGSSLIATRVSNNPLAIAYSTSTVTHSWSTASSQPWDVFGLPINPVAGGGTDLTASDSSHGHTADGLTLSIGVSLAIDDATHGHAADAVTLMTASTLAVADATHAHIADAPALSVESFLAVDDALHAHSADNVVLGVSGAVDLMIADATHAHSVDGLVLTAESLLAIQDALHAHAADALTIDTAPTLLIAEALHAHTADGVLLTVSAYLVVSDALHAHTADNILLSIPGAFRAGNPRVWILDSRQRYSLVDSRRRVVHLN
jgi:hypothetical protein